MKSVFFAVITLVIVLFESCGETNNEAGDSLIVGSGQMPDAVKDHNNILHIVYGKGDSILYSSSRDQGQSFSSPDLISVLPGLAASHMRGPQIASSINGVSVIAVNKTGNIFCYHKEGTGKWSQAVTVNDVDEVAKEELMDLGADGQYIYAAWLDLRNKHNEIYGASSTDGGLTWSKNKLIYVSPDSTVCECCKPSVVVKNDKVFVMFRNWLRGDRDLYLVESADAGNTFGEARKLGDGSWPLNGCPMDGGGLALNDKGIPETVWFRKSRIYSCQPGKPEIEIGQGRSCTMESIAGKNVYAWVENGDVIILKANHEKKVLGKGSTPVIRSISNEKILCIWENENQIHSAVVNI